MCLPKYCWVCCWNCSLDGGAKFFSIFRIITVSLQLLGTLENIITGKTKSAIEYVVSISVENVKAAQKELAGPGNYNDDYDHGSEDFVKDMIDLSFTIAMLLMLIGILYALIDIIVCSLAIHGMRRARPKMLLPYIIWTSFILILPIAILGLLVALIIYLTIIGFPVNSEVVAVFIVFFITFGLFFGWILWDLLIMSARYKQLKNAVGMDHVMLQEIPSDEKEKMLYPQLPKA